MEKYDLIFGLGRACACSQMLRRASLQLLSFPWDWLTSDRSVGPDLRFRADTLCNGFNSWFTPGDIEELPSEDWAPNRRCKSRSTRIAYLHDFPKSMSVEEAFPAVKAKYERRLARLRRLIASSKTVLVACLDLPGLCAPTPLEDVRYARIRLAEAFPGAKFDFVLFSWEKGRGFEDRIESTPEDGLLHIVFDFKDNTFGKPDYAVDLDRLASILRSRFEVRDYRSAAERKAQKRRSLEAKMRAAGVDSRLQYSLLRLGRHWTRFNLAASPRLMAAFARRKRFSHFVSLGNTCETAFRFWWKWRFLDSSLFSWTRSDSLDLLNEALGNFDAIGTGGLEFRKIYLWQCGNTGIYFHGRIRKFPNQPPPTPEALAEDKKELIGRLAYLKGKFIRQISDERSTLFAYRIPAQEIETPGLAERLTVLEDRLRALGARNWKLLLVAERRYAGKIPDGPGRFIRYVREFNPSNGVTKAELGDPVGWKAIFTEFAPEKILKQSKKYKFES